MVTIVNTPVLHIPKLLREKLLEVFVARKRRLFLHVCTAMHGDWSYCDHFTMCANVESLHCTPETTAILCQLYLNFKNRKGSVPALKGGKRKKKISNFSLQWLVLSKWKLHVWERKSGEIFLVPQGRRLTWK